MESGKSLIGFTGTLVLYRLLTFLAFPVIFLYLLIRLGKSPVYRLHFAERLGLAGTDEENAGRSGPVVWMHGVSVGEIASLKPLAEALLAAHPRLKLFVSTSTAAGRQVADSEFGAIAARVFYAPLDFSICVRRTMRQVRPDLLIVAETELWPNLWAEAHAQGARIALVNARISDRAWTRYRRLRFFFRPLLEVVDFIAAQTALDLERYRQLGLRADVESTLGNLKFDVRANTAKFPLDISQAHPVWIAGSTVGPEEGGQLQPHDIVEEEMVLETFRQLAGEFPRLLVILAPRQPARFRGIEKLLTSAGISFGLRSQGEVPELPGVMLLDSMGELAGLYRFADVVFVGGSIAPRGGHNILEPALAGAPVVVGPHMENFASIAEEFIAARAIRQIQNREELAGEIGLLLRDRTQASEMAGRAASLASRQMGAAGRWARALAPMLDGRPFREAPPLFMRFWLDRFADLWRWGGRRKRARDLLMAATREPLTKPVISIGGITVGGSGKTPVAAYLAEAAARRGLKPAILSRGYRRRSSARTIVASAGSELPTALTGDEAQIYLRQGAAALGIGSDRYASARVMAERLPAIDLFLLDDGFQHARMHRDRDIVVLDGLDPFGSGKLVPAGRLREPLASLSRATVCVVTRSRSREHLEGIAREVHRFNQTVPVFASRLKVVGWRDCSTGRPCELRAGAKVVAFCGLGNQRGFWQTLDDLDISASEQIHFGDHHVYRTWEVRRLAERAREAGAEALVTTEKDAANLPDRLQELAGAVPVLYLEVKCVMEDERGFLDAVFGPLVRAAGSEITA